MEFCDDNNCAECCKDARVPLLNEDIDKIIYHGYYDVFFVEEYKGIKLMRTKEDGSCVFFDQYNRDCKIYSTRPERCRLNPYCICEDNDEPHVDKDCQHSKQCNSDPNMVKRMHEYVTTLQKEVEWRRRTGYF